VSQLVVDASALILAVCNHDAAGEAVRALLIDQVRHAPHLIDAEVGNVLRRQERRGDLSPQAAATARVLAQRTVTVRHEHRGPLGEAAWVLRHQLTFYDALYAALAQALGVPLVTADGGVARAAPAGVTVHLV